MLDKTPFCAPTDRNKDFILPILKEHLRANDQVLEIGSGTGQHAVFFAENMPEIVWQPTELMGKVSWVEDRRSQASLKNIKETLVLGVSENSFQSLSLKYNAIFTANTLHIMSWRENLWLFEQTASVLESKGLFIVYGPFRFEGKYSSEGDQRFDTHLRGEDAKMGIRDFEEVQKALKSNGIEFLQKYGMPANNFTLVFQKQK